jgi:hypothetical protein
MALGVLAEALARVEHKLDLIINQSFGNTPAFLTGVGDPSHTCPLCKKQVRYTVDVIKKVLTRQCGCKTGLQPPIDLAAFAPPALPARETADGNDQEDRGDSNHRGERRRR